MLFLSGGPTAAACYDRAARYAEVDWSLVDIYMGDERCVPADDPDANQRLVREHLVEPLGGVGSFTPMPTDARPRTRCAADYDAVLREVLGRSGDRPDPPRPRPRRAHRVAVPGSRRASR